MPADLSLFSTWVGFFLPFEQAIALVVDREEQVEGVRLELARIGYDRVVGFTLGEALSRTAQISQLSAQDLSSLQSSGRAPHILDVRTRLEWEEFHIEGAIHIPLPALLQRFTSLPKGEPLAVICGAGNRSSIATSLLQARDFRLLWNVMGGMAAYRKIKPLPWHPADLVLPGEEI